MDAIKSLPFTDEEKDLLGRLADQLIPATDGMPGAAEIAVTTSGLSRLANLRPDLADALRTAISTLVRTNVRDAFAIKETRPDLFNALTAAIAGIYLTDQRVEDLLNYPGRPPLNVGDLDDHQKHQWALTRSVRNRGFIWRGDPSDAFAADDALTQ
jgi:hypothetical protein